MNSILQCLSSLDLFRSWLIKDKYYEHLYYNKLTELGNEKRKRENYFNWIILNERLLTFQIKFGVAFYLTCARTY